MTAHHQATGAVVFEAPTPGADIENVFNETIELLKLHWQEVAIYKDRRPLDPDYDFYRKMSKAKQFVGVWARSEGKVIGYAGYFLREHPHYKTWKMAVSDIYFVAPEYRTPFVAIGLFRKAEEYLRTLGVRSVVNETKKHKDLERLFRYLGYEPTATLWECIL